MSDALLPPTVWRGRPGPTRDEIDHQPPDAAALQRSFRRMWIERGSWAAFELLLLVWAIAVVRSPVHTFTMTSHFGEVRTYQDPTSVASHRVMQLVLVLAPLFGVRQIIGSVRAQRELSGPLVRVRTRVFKLPWFDPFLMRSYRQMIYVGSSTGFLGAIRDKANRTVTRIRHMVAGAFGNQLSTIVIDEPTNPEFAVVTGRPSWFDGDNVWCAPGDSPRAFYRPRDRGHPAAGGRIVAVRLTRRHPRRIPPTS